MNEKTAIDDSTVLERVRAHRLSNVVHDISGALFAARGYLRMALEVGGGVLPDSQRRFLAATQENITKLVTLTQELNDFLRVDELVFDGVGFRELLRGSVGAARASLPESKVRVVEDIGCDSLSTVGDRAKLALAMRIFLSRAFDFTGPDGVVSVRAWEENEKIMLEISAARGAMIPGVSVTGDLSLACKILRLHGGSVSVQDAANPLGYLVSCELPVIRRSEC
jgi:signal transduction histidine kinase